MSFVGNVYEPFGDCAPLSSGDRVTLLAPLLSLHQVTKRFHGVAAPVLDQVSFELAAGQLLCLFGANGSGKTTLLRILSTLVLPDQGEVRWKGRDLCAMEVPTRAAIGWVPAESRFYPRLTLYENLEFFGRLYHLSVTEIHRRIEALQQLWPVALPVRKPLQEFSSGMQRRAALMRGVLHEPTLLLLDEPTDHLDEPSAEAWREWVRTYVAHHNAVAVWVTHDPRDAVALRARTAQLSDGRLSFTSA